MSGFGAASRNACAIDWQMTSRIYGARKCQKCGQPLVDAPAYARQRRFCSFECTKKQVALTCSTCGVGYSRPLSQLEPGRPYCSRRCKNRYPLIERAAWPQPPLVPGASWISLGDGEFALVDATAVDLLGDHVWGWMQGKTTKYAVRQEGGRRVLMHRVIAGVPSGLLVDHINHDGLDNRRENLRAATYAQNSANSRKKRGKSTPYKGIERSDSAASWSARMRVNGRRLHLGSFATPEAAARAYDDAVRGQWGDRGLYNFPREGERSALDLY